MTTRRAFHTQVGRTRRKTEWSGPAAQGFQAVATTGAILLDSQQFQSTVTMVRTRGMVTIRPETSAADLEIVGAIGVALVSNEAFLAGIASIPEPFTDAEWGGWLLWRSFNYFVDFSDATGVGYPNWSFEIDGKAMRKIAPNDTMVTIVESQGGAFRVAAPLRRLFKLP